MTTDLRKEAEAIVDAYISKCDMVHPDGSSADDYDRDLIEPIVALVLLREAAARAECAKVCYEIGGFHATFVGKKGNQKTALMCAEAIEQLPSSPPSADESRITITPLVPHAHI